MVEQGIPQVLRYEPLKTIWQHGRSKSSTAAQVNTISVGSGEINVFHAAGYCRIVCNKGAAWVTSFGRPSDCILKPGESLLLEGRGKVIVSGGRDGATIEILTH